MSKNILIVEGEADRSFFDALCKKTSLGVTVKVAPPKQLGGSHNTKEGVLKLLPTYLRQLSDGDTTIERVAIVVDADSAVNGGGFDKTYQRVSHIVADYGFSVAKPLKTGGLLFPHTDGLNSFGLWVMPNNADEGMLENWISRCVSPSQQALFKHAIGVITSLPTPPLFKPIRRTKAEVATWLAWQERPGESLYTCVESNLLDTNADYYVGLTDWLVAVFS